MSPARLVTHSEGANSETGVLLAWEHLRKCFEAKVIESNAEAGEPLWTTAHSPGPAPRVVVRSTTWPANYVELSLDTAQASVECRFGPAIRRRDCSFPLRKTCDPASDETVLAVLDSLVFPDEN